MAEYLNSGRVFGRSIGNMKDATPMTKMNRARTAEQKEADYQENLRTLARFMAQRNARIARYRMPEVHKLRHKDIIM